ncbi:hypothetical protein ES703_124422 [subsurface metagenome]
MVVAGLCLALAQGSGIAGKPLLGLVSDTVLGGRRKPMLLLVSCIATIGCLGFAFMPEGAGFWLLLPLCGVVGFSLFGWAGVGYTLVAEIGGRIAGGTIVGFSLVILMLFSIFAPPFLGSIVDKTGSYFPFWLILAGAAAVSVILALFIRENYKPAEVGK